MRGWLYAGLHTLRSELMLLRQLWRRLWAVRRLRRAVWAALGLTLFLALLYVVLSLLVAAQLVRAKRSPASITPAALGLPYEELALATADGLTLRGWLVAPRAAGRGRMIILLHDVGGGRADPALMPLIAGLAEAGFSVLTFDGRGHGESQGERYTLSYDERHDLHAALDLAAQRGFALESTGVLGLGTGGATALLVAAEVPTLGALVVDSSFASLPDMVRAQLRRQHLPAALFLGVRWAVKLRYGPDLGNIVPEAAVARMVPRPLLVIHGMDDRELSSDHGRRLAHAAGPDSPSELWLVPEVGHLQALALLEDEYVRRVSSFFDRSLRSSP